MQTHSFNWRGLGFSLMLVVAITSAVSASSALAPVVMTIGKPPAQPAQNIFAAAYAATSSVPEQVAAVATTRMLQTPTIAEMIPQKGKFVAADLKGNKLYLYQDGALISEYSIVSKGRRGSHWETPSGSYNVQTKERSHFSTLGQVYMDYSMQFFGNYFIHGWPYYPDGKPVAAGYSGGCIRLTNEDAAKVFEFADLRTPLYVYDPNPREEKESLMVVGTSFPKVTARSYLVADLDTGDVLLEKDSSVAYPIASLTKLMTALVANETISYDARLELPRGLIGQPKDPRDTKLTALSVSELQYPLLMESNNLIAETLAKHYDTPSFVSAMNRAAKALHMTQTRFDDPTGLSKRNVSTVDDLFRLSSYLEFRKSYVFDITRTPQKTLIAGDGATYLIKNYNEFSLEDTFIGGKVGFTEEAGETMVSLFTIPIHDENRRLAIIVLQSSDNKKDTVALRNWASKQLLLKNTQTACAACSAPSRSIEILRD